MHACRSTLEDPTNGLSDTVKLSFDGTNQLPVPQIDEPAASLTWSVDDVIEFSGSATDEEDGALPPSALKWTLVLHHCVGLTCHEHTVQTLPGVASGSFQAPDHEYPSHLELRLTAKDDDAGSTTTSVELQPKTTTLDVASVPAGVRIDVGDQAKTSPSRTTLIRGGTTTIVAPAVWSAGSNRYRFATWSDGKARAHEVTVTDPASRSATYVPDAADACSAAKAITPGAWVSERTTAGNDVDWFKLTLSGRRRVVVTLGDLPVNAKLELYGACSSRLASTDHAGTRFERLTRSLPAGTYRVRVSVPSGTRSMTPWSLRVLVVNDRVALESRTVRWTAGTARVVGRVVNGTGGVVGRVAVVATFKDAQGRVVGTLRGTTFANRLPDGDASSFALSGRVPAFVSVAYSLRAGRPGSARALTLSSLGGVAGAGGTVMETGSVRNTGRVTLTEVRAERTWLGKRGEALDVRSAPVSPSTLAPGASGTFKIVRPALANLQATATALRAR